MAWLIASLSYACPFITTRLKSMKGTFLLGIINNAGVNIRMHISFGISVFVFFSKYPKAKFLDHIVVLFKYFRNLPTYFHVDLKRYTRIPFSTPPHQQFLFIYFLMLIMFLFF